MIRLVFAVRFIFYCWIFSAFLAFNVLRYGSQVVHDFNAAFWPAWQRVRMLPLLIAPYGFYYDPNRKAVSIFSPWRYKQKELRKALQRKLKE